MMNEFNRGFFFNLQIFCKCNSSVKLRGFTLAEVLITLGVIGVVSALTIPMLLSKYHEIQYKVSYKKVYSSLGQVMKHLQEDDGIDMSIKSHLHTWHDKDGNPIGTGTVSEDFGKIFKYMSRYYNAKTTCFENNADKCWECYNGESGLNNFDSIKYLGCDRQSYAFIDGAGISYYMYQNKEPYFIVDINSFNKPNQLGRDRFVLKFGNSIEPKVSYPSSVDAVFLWADRIEKGRWCPQGNCYYTSWIRGQR